MWTTSFISDVYPLADWRIARVRFERYEGVKLLLDPWSGATANP